IDHFFLLVRSDSADVDIIRPVHGAELACRPCLFPGPIARSLPSSERDSAVQVCRGRSDHANPRVTLEAGRIFHSAGVLGSSVPQPPLCPAQSPQSRLSQSRLPRTRLSLFRLLRESRTSLSSRASHG